MEIQFCTLVTSAQFKTTLHNKCKHKFFSTNESSYYIIHGKQEDNFVTLH